MNIFLLSFLQEVRKQHSINHLKGLSYETAKERKIPCRSDDMLFSHYKNVDLIVNFSWLYKRKKTIFREYWNHDFLTQRLDYIAAAVTQN